jgi:hypothetical protein
LRRRWSLPRNATRAYWAGDDNMRPRGAIRPPLDSEAKARQAAKLAEIREALIAAGCDSAAKQAAVLRVSRPTAWVVLNRDKRVGPSAIVIKRILSSPNLPPAARRKVEEYVEERIAGLYGHSEESTQWFRDRLRTFASPTNETGRMARIRMLQIAADYERRIRNE